MKRIVIAFLLFIGIAFTAYSQVANYIVFHISADDKYQVCVIENYDDVYVKELCSAIGIEPKKVVLNDLINKIADKGYKVNSYGSARIGKYYS